MIDRGGDDVRFCTDTGVGRRAGDSDQQAGPARGNRCRGGRPAQLALSNLALSYSAGTFTRLDYARACYYAHRPDSGAPGNGLLLKGDCCARGLDGTRIDRALANEAYKAATAKGAVRPTSLEG